MSWSLGYDSRHGGRDIGYSVPAFCDHPGCGREIDRGLAHVCGGEPYGGERGCGLYFCGYHLQYYPQLCERCNRPPSRVRKPFPPTFDHPLWIRHKLTHPSWADWRAEQGEEKLEALRERIGTTIHLDLREDSDGEVAA